MKYRNHRNWVRYQFEKYLKASTYRNALIHLSLIESLLMNRTGVKGFDVTNKMLLCKGEISPDEFCLFDKMRQDRNKLVHHIFPKGKKEGMGERAINHKVTQLMEKIKRAYRQSKFLNEALIKQYELEDILEKNLQ